MNLLMRRVIARFLQVLREFGYLSDSWMIWNLKERVLASVVALIGSVPIGIGGYISDLSLFLTVPLFIGSGLLAFYVFARVISYIRKHGVLSPKQNDSSLNSAVEHGEPKREKVGIRTKNSKLTGKNWHIEGQDVGIDDEGSDYNVRDLDIK